MNYTIKPIALLCLFAFLLNGCMIVDPRPEDCDIKEITVSKISEGGVKDIVLTEENGDFYYINRGLEQGLTLEQMEENVLNKTVTLHLPRIITGTSNHIAQLEISGDIVFTEFSNKLESAILKD
tara:strand:- start:6379 stop:6750 length:372 start_codon:yes stop_codon:yes gene_type:complete